MLENSYIIIFTRSYERNSDNNFLTNYYKITESQPRYNVSPPVNYLILS